MTYQEWVNIAAGLLSQGESRVVVSSSTLAPYFDLIVENCIRKCPPRLLENEQELGNHVDQNATKVLIPLAGAVEVTGLAHDPYGTSGKPVIYSDCSTIQEYWAASAFNAENTSKRHRCFKAGSYMLFTPPAPTANYTFRFMVVAKPNNYGGTDTLPTNIPAAMNMYAAMKLAGFAAAVDNKPEIMLRFFDLANAEIEQLYVREGLIPVGQGATLYERETGRAAQNAAIIRSGRGG